MISIKAITHKAERLLTLNPSPAARHRLLRDILHVPPQEAELLAAAEELEGCRQVQILVNEQRADGGWGGFHSRRSDSKQRIPSTELAVERAINLGLSPAHPALAHAASYILAIMHGDLRFPDYHEKNDRWTTGMRLFLASTLSLIDPGHEQLDADRDLWREIAVRTFRSGTYLESHETAAHAELTGATVKKNSYLKIDNRYALNILGSQPGLLPEAVEGALLAWLWNSPEGIGYLEMPLSERPPLSHPGRFDRWLASLEMLARLFPGSANLIAGHADWLWDLQSPDGLWDLGSRASTSTFFPLAADWRRPLNRKIDWSTRLLLLMNAVVSLSN